MTRDDLTLLTEALGRVHNVLPTYQPNKLSFHRGTVLKAIEELTLFQLREEAS